MTEPLGVSPSVRLERLERLKSMAYDELLKQHDAIVEPGRVWRKGNKTFGGAAVWFAPHGTTRFYNGQVEIEGVWEPAQLIGIW